MRMGNPSMRRVLRRAESDLPEGERASYAGIAKKSMLYLGLTVIAAAAVIFALYAGGAVAAVTIYVGLAVSAIPMLIISLVVAFVPSTVKVLGIVYSILQGGFLGVLVFCVDQFAPGVALAAVLATLIVFAVAVLLNRYLEVRVSSKFMRILIIAFVSFLAVQLILLICSLFVMELSALYTTYLWLQLAISVFCVFYATVLLLWDLQTADMLVANGASKRYEWQVAFSLSTTIVYLYIEILELILRLMQLFGRDN